MKKSYLILFALFFVLNFAPERPIDLVVLTMQFCDPIDFCHKASSEAMGLERSPKEVRPLFLHPKDVRALGCCNKESAEKISSFKQIIDDRFKSSRFNFSGPHGDRILFRGKHEDVLFASLLGFGREHILVVKTDQLDENKYSDAKNFIRASLKKEVFAFFTVLSEIRCDLWIEVEAPYTNINNLFLLITYLNEATKEVQKKLPELKNLDSVEQNKVLKDSIDNKIGAKLFLGSCFFDPPFVSS